MSSFDLKLGFVCNNNCIHCVIADKRDKGNLELDEIKKLIDSVPKGMAIQLTGGEPSIRQDLPEILKFCREKGHETIVQTNGTGFSDPVFTSRCSPYINHAHVAIHSCDPTVHDRIVQSNGMWKKTIKGFENLCKAGIFVTTQTVLSKLNITTIHDTFCFIQGIAEGTRMSMTYPHLGGNAWTNSNLVAFRYSDYRDEIQKTLKAFAHLVFTEAIPPCYLYPYQDEVQCTAESCILSGLNNRIGIDFSRGADVNDYNLSDIQCHRKAPRCKECIFNSKCIGVWKEYIQLFKDRLDLYPIKEENKCSDLQIM